MTKQNLTKLTDAVGFLLIAIFIIYGFVMAARGQEAFMNYLKEDGLVESLTAIFLFFSGFAGIFGVVRNWKTRNIKGIITWSVIALMFFFAAGEDISWGQRIFNIPSSEFFMKHNFQKETNIHNLVVGNIKINKLVFSQMLFCGLVVYLLLLRPLATKVSFVNRFLCDFNVPLARWYYAIALGCSALLIHQYNMLKDGELYEFAYATIFLLILIHPYFLQKENK